MNRSIGNAERRPGARFRTGRGMSILSIILELRMAITERVTVTLSVELVRDIDRFERSRGRFITEAVEHELIRRRRAELLQSLASPPHP